MTAVVDLLPEVEALATALGLMRHGTLDTSFFADPLARVRSILSNPDQRVALLAALDGVLPSDGSPVHSGDGDTTRHPLVSSQAGSVSLSVTRSGPAENPDVVVGLWASAADVASGVALEVDLPLVRASGSSLAVVAGSTDHPLAVGVQVPLGWERPAHPVGLAAVSLSALVLAPPVLARSRVAVVLHGLDLGVGPAADLVLDPFDLGPDLAHALTMLVVAGLAQSEAAAQDDVVRLVQHLPGALGLDGRLPLLPLGRLLSDPAAFRTWLGALTQAEAAGGEGLHDWVDSVARLLGAAPVAAPAGVLPTSDEPLVVTLADGGTAGVTVQARLWVVAGAAGRAGELHVAIDVHLVGSVARLAARAELLVVPLDGSEPSRALTSAEVVVESNEPLLPGAGGPLTVGVGRGGLRWDGTEVVPVLELDHVHVDLPGVVQHPTDFDRLDLSHAKTLAAEAKEAVGDFLTAQLGVGSEASAVVALLGLSVPPSADDLGAFANDPLRFVGHFHRAALDAHAYEPVAQQVVALLGATTPVTGAGTSDDPWSAGLAGAADGSGAQLRATVWDVPSGTDHEVHVGLQVQVSTASAAPSCTAGVLVDLLSFRLPATGPSQPALLGRVRADVVLRPSAAPLAVVRADDLHLALDWTPGAGLHPDATVHGLVVDVDGTDVALPDLGLPDGLTPALMDSAWPAARVLLGRAARSWGGGVGAAVADLLGLTRSEGLPSTWPLLEPPSGHLTALLDDPVGALRGRLGDLLSAAADPEGRLPVLAVLDRVRDVLTRSLPARPDLPGLPTVPVAGSGSYEDPWRVPLTDPATPVVSQPVDVLVWAEPGPPRSWGAFVRGLLEAEEPDLATALEGIRGRLTDVADTVVGLEPDTAARWLTTAGQALDGTDGLVAGDQGTGLPPGATVLPGRPTAAHLTAPGHPEVVAATTGHLQANGAGGLPTLLLAPSFAPDDVWAALLAGVAADQQVRVDLRVPGVSPDVADLTTLTTATHYVVNLADDGTPTLDQLAARLHRVVTRVAELTGTAKVALVAHSVAGVVAAHYAAAHAGLCQAVVTIAAPLAGGGPAVLRVPEAASGVRLVRSLLPGGVPLPALDRALGDLASLLDGYTGISPTPFPAAAFDRALAPGLDLTSVPTLAVWTGLEAPLVPAVSATLGTAYDALPDTSPTHLGWGLACDLDLGPDTAVAVDLRARADLGVVALAGTEAPAHPAGRLCVDALVHRPDGWLVGSGGTGAPLDVRLRSARLRYDVSPDATTLDVTLYDGAVNGSGAPRLDLQDARAGRLTGALVDAVAAEASPGSAALGLMQLLAALELVTFDPSTRHATMRADAVDALVTDPGGWLGVRAFHLLRDQPALLALTPLPTESGRPLRWRRPLGSLPVDLVVSSAPWTVGLRTTGAGLDLGDGASVSVEALLPLGAAPSLSTAVTAAGLTVDVVTGAEVPDGAVVHVSAPPLLEAVQVFPVPAAAPSQAVGDAAASPSTPSVLAAALSTTGLAAVLSGVLQDALGGVLPVGSLVGLLDDPAAWFTDPRRLGDGHGLLDPAAVPALLAAVASALGLPVDADGLLLADGLHVRASATASSVGLGLTAADLSPVAGGPSLDLDLRLDAAFTGSVRTVRPGGTAKVTAPLSGGSWPSVALVVGLAGDQVTLGVQPGGGTLIPLLPHFGGLWDLLGGGVKALLPGVLDRLVQELSPVAPGGVLEHVLAVTDALGLRTGAPASFDSEALAALVAKAAAGDLTPSPGTLAAVAAAVLPAGAPVTVGGSGGRVDLSLDSLPVAGSGRLVADLPAGGAPTVELHLDGVVLGPVVADVRVGDDAGAFGFDVRLRVDVPTDLGFDFTPALAVSGLPLTVDVLPLGPESALRLELAPTPGISPDASALGGLLVAWAEPVAAKAALEATRSLLDTPLWTPPEGTALTGRSLLLAAGLLVDSGGTSQLVRPLPEAPAVLRGLLGGLDVLRIPVAPDLAIGVYSEGSTWLGLGLTGHLDLDAGDLVVSALLGSAEAAWVTPRAGLGLLLLDDSAGLVPRPGLRLGAVGIGVRKKSGPLVDSDVVQLHDVAALVQASLDLSGSGVVTSSLHAGVRLGQVGLPMGGSSSPANAIAASLLKPSGSSGDDKPATPPVDLSVLSSDSGSLSVQVNARAVDQPFFFDVHKTFGPLHIDRIGLQHLLMGGLGDGMAALVDGGVAIAGLTVDVQGLTLAIPLKHPAELNLWDVDLAGLAMSFSAGPVSIEGGLLKSTLPTGVEYDGMVKVEVGSFGLTALAGYAKASGDGDSYTSLFVFVVVDAPLGGPPFLFVTGIAGGAGYNRQLVVPADPAVIPTYPLVRAMSEGVGSDPMGALHQMSKAMPPRRGSYWVAAGVKFTTFGLINTKALAYVALDRGFEVGLMGLMTMALPTPDEALVSVELALLARYSTADQLLALRAQLTNNSWLISKDCQLTGGFAFYSWFGDKPSVLLTIGGTGPNWIPRSRAPGARRAARRLPLVGGQRRRGQGRELLRHHAAPAGLRRTARGHGRVRARAGLVRGAPQRRHRVGPAALPPRRGHQHRRGAALHDRPPLHLDHHRHHHLDRRLRGRRGAAAARQRDGRPGDRLGDRRLRPLDLSARPELAGVRRQVRRPARGAEPRRDRHRREQLDRHDHLRPARRQHQGTGQRRRAPRRVARQAVEGAARVRCRRRLPAAASPPSSWPAGTPRQPATSGRATSRAARSASSRWARPAASTAPTSTSGSAPAAPAAGPTSTSPGSSSRPATGTTPPPCGWSAARSRPRSTATCGSPCPVPG